MAPPSAGKPRIPTSPASRNSSRTEPLHQLPLPPESVRQSPVGDNRLRPRRPTAPPPQRSAPPLPVRQPPVDDDSLAPRDTKLPQRKRAGSDIEEPVSKKTRNAAQDGARKPATADIRCAKESLNLSQALYRGINLNERPIHQPSDISDDLVARAYDAEFEKSIDSLLDKTVTFGTLCSGTESPLLGMQLFATSLKKIFGRDLKFEQRFSCEIEPYKQAYIERNFRPPILFRDIVEVANDEYPKTAFGGSCKVPEDVDIYVAGSSCTSFSGLNGKRNTDLTKKSESSDTFIAVVKTAKNYRPKIVIIENVYQAPWLDMSALMENDRNFDNEAIRACCEEIWDESDLAYATIQIKLDTKNHYIPQTRQRGYLLCILRDCFESADEKVKIWAQIISELRRSASSSMEDFLLPTDDPRIRDARARSFRTKNTKKTGSGDKWPAMKNNHQYHREKNQLGHQRYFTHWKEGGYAIPLDHMDRNYFRKSMVSRQHDVVEIEALRAAMKGQDIFYKSRVLDISQSTERQTESHPPGIVGCITPSGQCFMPSRGGPITGLECMALQGLPIDTLSLNRESERQLMDLAGNAMSTTVIMTVLVAMFKAGALNGFGMPDTQALTISKPILSSISRPAFIQPRTWIEQPLNVDARQEMSALTLHDLARATFQYCHCESPKEMAARPLQKCQDCGHTTCRECGLLPKHRYQDFTPDREPPKTFDELARSSLPIALSFIEGEFQFRDLTKALGLEGSYENHLIKAFCDTYRYEGISRSHRRTVTFKGQSSRLVLSFTNQKMEWLLFAMPDPIEPGNSKLRRSLLGPIAKMSVDTTRLFDGIWYIRKPSKRSADITITGCGEQVPSWQSKIGLQKPEFRDSKVWSELNIQMTQEASAQLELDLSGLYQALPDCGMAMDTLYKKVAPVSANESPSFFFLDQNPIGEPAEDKFVFTKDKQRMRYNELREVAAYVSPTYRLSDVPRTTVECTSMDDWQPALANPHLASLGSPQASSVSRLNLSEVFSLRNFNPTASPKSPNRVGSTCKDEAIAVFECVVPLERATSLGFPDMSSLSDGELFIPPTAQMEDDIHTDLAWCLDTVIESHISMFAGEIDLPEGVLEDCKSCSPAPPALDWALKGNKFVPHENVSEACVFERALKGRPLGLIAELKKENGSCVLTIGLNVGTLIHRLSPVISLWSSRKLHLCVDTSFDAKGESVAQALVIKDNKSDPKINVELPEFLNADQRQLVTWMIERENDRKSLFCNQEIVEAVCPRLGARVRIVAEGLLRIRGGFLADDPGFGKTVSCLGLIDHQYDRDRHPDVEEAKGSIRIKATLVVVPDHLTIQWKEEIDYFLQADKGILHPYKILLASRTGSRRIAVTVKEVQDADIIIIARSQLETQFYWEDVAALAGLPPGPVKGDRAFEAYVEKVVPRFKDSVQTLKLGQVTPKDLATSLNDTLSEAECDETLHRIMPLRRLRGPEYAEQKEAAAKANSETQAKAKSAASKKKSKEQQQPWDVTYAHMQCNNMDEVVVRNLHLFQFARLIVDEAKYLTFKEKVALWSMNAESRWVLSGAYPMTGYPVVHQVARCLGVDLGMRSDTDGKSGYKTDAERFRQLTEVESNDLHLARHGLAQAFLDHTTRKNSPDIGHLQHAVVFIVVAPSFVEFIAYEEVRRQISGKDLNSSNSASYDPGHSNEELKDLMKQTSSVPSRNSNKQERKTTAEMRRDAWIALVQCQADFGSILKHAAWLGSKHCTAEEGKTQECKRRDCKACEWQSQVKGSQVDDLHVLEWIVKQLGLAQKDVANFKIEEHYRDPVSKEVLKAEKDEDRNRAKALTQAKKDLVKVQKRLEKASQGISKIKSNSKGNSEQATSDENQPSFDSDLDEDYPAIEPNLDEGQPAIDLELAEMQQRVAELQPRIRLPFKIDEQKAANYYVPLREQLRQLTDLRTKMVEHMRTFRRIRYLKEAKSSGWHSWCKSCSESPEASETPASVILASCGHLLCPSCEAKICADDDYVCPVKHCTARANAHLRTQLAVYERLSCTPEPQYGSKFDKVIDLIKNKIPREDQVLLFMQFEDEMSNVSAALTLSDIKHKAIMSAAKTRHAKMLDEFSKSTADSCKLLLLNSADDSAAGSNLANTNHVIFLAPLIAESTAEWHAQYQQAIGRSLRYRQKKKVFIYHFLVEKTVEVNIYQTKTQQILIRKPHAQQLDSDVPASDDAFTWLMVNPDDVAEDEEQECWADEFVREGDY